MPLSLLDGFLVLVRECRALPSDGYELILEIHRRRDASEGSAKKAERTADELAAQDSPEVSRER
jgi:hypothetical protein